MSAGYVVGLTGGIASGKSAVAKILKEMGIWVIDADIVARQIVEPSQPAWQEILEFFGPNILNKDGTLNRAELGRIIFQDPQARQVLNQITHPRIRAEINKQLEEAKRIHDIVVLEIPLLIEGGVAYPVDEIWVVNTDEMNQIQRLMIRNGFTEQEARERILSQMPLREKVARADRVIENDSSLAELKNRVQAMVFMLQRQLASRVPDIEGENDCGKE